MNQTQKTYNNNYRNLLKGMTETDPKRQTKSVHKREQKYRESEREKKINRREELETSSTKYLDPIDIFLVVWVVVLWKPGQRISTIYQQVVWLAIASLVSGWCGFALLFELRSFHQKTFIIWKCMFHFLSFFFYFFLFSLVFLFRYSACGSKNY